MIKKKEQDEFVNVSGAQESIPPAYVAWRAAMITLFVIPADQATKSGGIDSWAPNTSTKFGSGQKKIVFPLSLLITNSRSSSVFWNRVKAG